MRLRTKFALLAALVSALALAAAAQATNFAAWLVRSVKPRPGVCTVSSDDAIVVACTDDGAERVTDLADVMKGPA